MQFSPSFLNPPFGSSTHLRSPVITLYAREGGRIIGPESVIRKRDKSAERPDDGGCDPEDNDGRHSFVAARKGLTLSTETSAVVQDEERETAWE